MITIRTDAPKSLMRGERKRVMTRYPTAPPAFAMLTCEMAEEIPGACSCATWRRHALAESMTRNHIVRRKWSMRRPATRKSATMMQTTGTIHTASPTSW